MKVGRRFEQDEEGLWWYRSGTRRFAAEVRICPCGEEYVTCRNPTQASLYCSRSCCSRIEKRAHHAHSLPGPNHHNWRGGRIKAKGGYIKVHAPTHPAVRDRRAGHKYVLEHRLVMEGILGRYLLPDENVHHKNGIRDDNRPENLEVWTTAQPCGQRAQDKLAFAREMIRRYSALPT